MIACLSPAQGQDPLLKPTECRRETRSLRLRSFTCLALTFSIASLALGR